MANFKTPYTFIAGTKAKAEEVNGNFDAIKDELNKKLDKNEDGTVVVKEATSDNQAINKKQLDDKVEELDVKFSKITSTIEYKKSFLVESGNTNSCGEVDLLDIDDISKVVFKVDENVNYKPLKCVLANSDSFELKSIEDLSVGELADGVYNLFIGNDGTCIPLSNKIYKQKNEPCDLIETSFVQPVITSNGNVGGDSFAVWADNEGERQACGAFDGTNSQCWWATKPNAFIGFYNPKPLKIEKLSVVNNGTSNITTIAKGDVYGSHDGTEWIKLTSFTNSNQGGYAKWDIIVNSNTAYKYHKLQATQIIGTTSYTNYTIITELEITATQEDGFNLTNAVWLDTSTRPYVSKKYNGSTWEVFNYVHLPQTISVKSGVITAVNNVGKFNDNGWDDYVMLPDMSRSTVLTNGITFKPTLNGWISNKEGLVQPIFIGESYMPSEDNFVFYAMKGE